MIQNCYIGSEEKEQHCIFMTNPCDILLVLEVYFSEKKKLIVAMMRKPCSVSAWDKPDIQITGC